MIRDLNEGRQTQPAETFDVCIAGAGMAGITLAVDLAEQGLRVLLLEAGGLEYEEESQKLYRGENIGRAYFDLDAARLRYLGGTSNHWNGWCRPLDAIDFSEREHIPLSGWPIAKTDVQDYQQEVSEILEIPNNFDDLELPAQSADLRRITMLQSNPTVRFAEKYGARLEELENIALYLNANLIDIRIDEVSGRITEFICVNYRDPTSRHSFTARYFVLALGGIENPRIMLASRSQTPSGIGNRFGWVGRCFAEHPHLMGGVYVANRSAWPFRDTDVWLSPNEDFLKRKEIGNVRVVLDGVDLSLKKEFIERARAIFCSADFLSDFVRLFRSLHCDVEPSNFGLVRVISEQVPNPQSRILLTDKLDRFGVPIAALDWRVKEVDRHTVTESVRAAAQYLARHGYANLKLADWIVDSDAEVPDVETSKSAGAGWHHMGTTRAAADPSSGVVDGNCAVYGHENLYIAGSSVFSSVGHANPSFTLLQLSLRLSRHLGKLAS